jgi:hypothetical protein
MQQGCLFRPLREGPSSGWLRKPSRHPKLIQGGWGAQLPAAPGRMQPVGLERRARRGAAPRVRHMVARRPGPSLVGVLVLLSQATPRSRSGGGCIGPSAVGTTPEGSSQAGAEEGRGLGGCKFISQPAAANPPVACAPWPNPSRPCRPQPRSPALLGVPHADHVGGVALVARCRGHGEGHPGRGERGRRAGGGRRRRAPSAQPCIKVPRQAVARRPRGLGGGGSLARHVAGLTCTRGPGRRLWTWACSPASAPRSSRRR